MLIGAFGVEICWPVAVCAALEREGMRRAGVEPHVEDVFDLLVSLRIVVAEEIAGRPREPGVGALPGD